MSDADRFAAKIDALTDEQFGPPPTVLTEHELTQIALGRAAAPTQPEADEFQAAARAFRDARTVTGKPRAKTYVIGGDVA